MTRTAYRVWLMGLALFGAVMSLGFVLLFLRGDYHLKLFHRFVSETTWVEAGPRYQEKRADHAALIAQARHHGTLHSVFIGDSLTENWLLAGRFPHALNLGIRGDTVSGVQARLPVGDLGIAPVWVVRIGVNDIARGRAGEDLLSDTLTLMQQMQGVEQLYWAAVLPVARPGWAPEQEALRQRVNTTTGTACQKQANCTFLPEPPEMQGGSRPGIASLTTDGLHLNARGYRLLAQQMCRHIPCAAPQP